MTRVSAAAREGLSTRQAKSLKATRRSLERALERLVSGKPEVAKKDARLSVAAVCEEAGIERSTLYRYHEPVLRAIDKAKRTIRDAGASDRAAREARSTKKRD